MPIWRPEIETRGLGTCITHLIPSSFGPVDKISFKDISILSSDDHFVLHSRTVCAILVEGNMKNISVKSF